MCVPDLKELSIEQDNISLWIRIFQHTSLIHMVNLVDFLTRLRETNELVISVLRLGLSAEEHSYPNATMISSDDFNSMISLPDFINQLESVEARILMDDCLTYCDIPHWVPQTNLILPRKIVPQRFLHSKIFPWRITPQHNFAILPVKSFPQRLLQGHLVVGGDKTKRQKREEEMGKSRKGGRERSHAKGRKLRCLGARAAVLQNEFTKGNLASFPFLRVELSEEEDDVWGCGQDTSCGCRGIYSRKKKAEGVCVSIPCAPHSLSPASSAYEPCLTALHSCISSILFGNISEENYFAAPTVSLKIFLTVSRRFFSTNSQLMGRYVTSTNSNMTNIFLNIKRLNGFILNLKKLHAVQI
ncbi:hypothetical protein VP01_3086g1 [Puccinia sorghi]|uniref:Uncharacterized protein n=1 Tax=Puccinia sorghi TaxID=27349 RepID=A0A0L6UZR1_9BASI|nr:hypothetical protein VP01_3086g1 [Puccinia sorghi]